MNKKETITSYFFVLNFIYCCN